MCFYIWMLMCEYRHSDVCFSCLMFYWKGKEDIAFIGLKFYYYGSTWFWLHFLKSVALLSLMTEPSNHFCLVIDFLKDNIYKALKCIVSIFWER